MGVNMIIIGVTGGMGAGKSRVLAYLEEKWNARTIRLDDVSRELLEKNGLCYEETIHIFGKKIVKPDGNLDRALIAKMIFEDSRLRDRLNALVHPAVKAQVRWIAEEMRQLDAGLFVVEAALLIEGGYVTDPVVTVNLMNFHVTVIGEVHKPRVVVAEGSRLTIFEALAQCGDITIDGLRTNVVVVRSGINTQTVDTLDLTRKEILNSPYYYLQQNDIIFVEPTEKKKRKAWRNEDWPKYLNIGVQSLRVAYTTIYYIKLANK